MRILFVGEDSGTSRHRAQAMRRLGHEVLAVDPEKYWPGNRVAAKFHYETGSLLIERAVEKRIVQEIEGQQWDVAWVDGGRLIGPRLAKKLASRGPVINYNHDDPLGNRDRQAWLLYRRAVPAYDLIVVRRDPNIQEAYERGAKKVMRVTLAVDEVDNARREITEEDRARWGSDVMFIGTWMPERGPFMAQLLSLGVPLAIYGNRWQRAPEWRQIKHAWRGPGMSDKYDEYSKIIQCAKISLGLLSKGNRDLHTRRSVEIPFLGGLLCAERTTEHQEMYVEGEEAVFWSTPEECAGVCRELLADEEKRQQIAHRGNLRCLKNGHFNERLISRILEEV